VTARHEAVGDAERIDEARAHGLDVEGDADRRAQLALDDGRGRREGHVGRGRGDDDQVDVGGGLAGVGQGASRGLDGQVAGRLVVARLVALADAGALLDPLVAGVDDLGQVGVGDDLLGQIGTDAGDGAANNAHCRVSPEGAAASLASGAAEGSGHDVGQPAQLGARPRPDSRCGQVDADADGVAEALGVGAAVALHDDAVQAQQRAAVDGAGVDLLAHGAERRHGDQAPIFA
jgi:hypothetical protein